MEYKIVPDAERLIVVNEDAFGLFMECTPNLGEGELKIVSLEVDGCPIHQLCVVLSDGITSLCKFGAINTSTSSLLEDTNSHRVGHLLCSYDDGLVERRITALEAEGCPSRRKNCVECIHLEAIVLPSGPNPVRSHASVVCRLVTG
jgi:hypothetical protein